MLPPLSDRDPGDETEEANVSILSDETFATRLARRFHDIYEAAAPLYDWQTQERSRVEWDDLPENQRQLMVYVCGCITNELQTHVKDSLEQENDG